MNNEELYHHGIKGQKWGVRRYQNADGSLTAEGFQRYGLNPDGSRFRQKKSLYSRNTESMGKIGTAAGLVAGAALLGPAGVLVGTMGGMTLGMAAGAIDTSIARKKIKRALDEHGTVYVRDL